MAPERGWTSVPAVLDGATAAIFDNDGTLVDTMGAHHAAWVSALAPFNIAFPPTRFYALGGMPAAAIVTLLAAEQGVVPAPDAAAVAARKAAWRDTQGRGVVEAAAGVQCVLQVLRKARALGMKVAVVSGGERKDVLGSLVAAGVVDGPGEEQWGKVFGALVTAKDVTNGKPNPEGFLLAAKRLGVNPEKCVGFEDADLGLQALQAAGMRAVDVRLHKDYPLPDEVRQALLSRDGKE